MVVSKYEEQVVSDNAKILILKQITTVYCQSAILVGLCLIMQRY